MKYKGINFDAGNNYRKDRSSRESFNTAEVEKEIGIIKNELNCNAIRISGYDLVRLVPASEIALKNGLTVFFSPQNINASVQETRDYILQSAKKAEELRNKYQNVVFVLGCELSIFARGFIGGETVNSRLQRMFNPFSIFLNMANVKRKYNKKLNDFMLGLMPFVREHFKGDITYASGTWEMINWEMFDIIGIDHYRAKYNKSFYREELKKYFSYNKPVAVLEFGCCTYKGAEDKGGAGWLVVDWAKNPPEIKGNLTRDDSIQSDELREMLDIFIEENVLGAFVFTFVQPSLIHDEDPRYDLDMASYGIMAPVKGASGKAAEYVKKKSFSMIADYYSNRI